MIHLNIWWYL